MRDELPAARLAMRGVVVEAFPAEPAPAAEERPLLAEEQVAYANLLDVSMRVGLLGLVATFFVYASGVLPPVVPMHELPRYWSLPVKELLAATGGHTGWAWVHQVHRGDVLNLVGIAFLAGVTVLCYAAIIPIFVRRKERVYAWLAVLEVAVLSLAASGLLHAGGH